MTGAEGRPAASSVMCTMRPSPQQPATSEPPSGATATWQFASPVGIGAPSGTKDASPVRRKACTACPASSAA